MAVRVLSTYLQREDGRVHLRLSFVSLSPSYFLVMGHT